MIPSDTRPTLEDCETACGAISCGCSTPTAALVGVWRGEAAVHLNLFPETSRAALIATGKLRFHRDRRVGARGSAPPQAQRQSSRGLWAAPLLAEGSGER